MRRYLTFFAVNGAFGALLWYGLAKDSVGAARLLFVGSVALALLWTFAAAFQQSREAARKIAAERPVLSLLDRLYDLAILVTLIWFGWIWTMVAYGWHAALREMILGLPEPEKEAEEAPPVVGEHLGRPVKAWIDGPGGARLILRRGVILQPGDADNPAGLRPAAPLEPDEVMIFPGLIYGPKNSDRGVN